MGLAEILARTAARSAAGADQTYPEHAGGAAKARTPARPRRKSLPALAECRHGGTDADIVERCPSCNGGAKHVRECDVHGRCTWEAVNPAVMDCAKCQREGLGFEPAPQAPGATAARLPVAANGIGDHLIALTLAAAWKAANPTGRLYIDGRVHARQWLGLFEGFDDFGPGPAGAATIHDYGSRAGRHYAEVASRAGPRAMPKLKPLPAEALAWAERYRGCVVLVPRAAHSNRIWHRSHWLHLETLLAGRGVSTVVIGSAGDRSSLGGLRSPTYCGESPERIAALLSVAAVTVANESGMAHLAGALGAPVVVLAAQLSGRAVHGFWPRSVQIQGPLSCSGCHFRGPNYKAACREVCASLQAIDPETVAEVVIPYTHAAQSKPRLTTTHPLDVIAGAAEFPADELAGLFSSRDRHENLAEWLARYAALFGVVRELNPRRVVTIGVRAGYSDWAICRAAPNAAVIGFDLNVNPAKGNSHGGYLGAWEHAAAINAGHNWHLVLCDSHQIDRLPAADLVLIDGDHTFAGCTADLELAERSGAAAILVDDYATADLEVRAACDAFVSNRPHLAGRFIDNGSTGLYLIERVRPG